MIQSVCVCGAGTMGSGIAQLAAQSGYATILYEPNREVLENAAVNLDKSLSSLVAKEKISAGKKSEILSLLTYTADIEICRADLFIEAIVERIEAKVSLFGQLAGLNKSGSIFASNTSSLSINVMASAIPNPERVIGMHFFNPAPIMKLVEVVTADHTSIETINTILDLSRKMGKTPVVCRDSPGFIVNRVARPFYIESLRLVEEVSADLAVVDRLLEATGFRMGPFKLMDLIGNDINYAVSCSVYAQLGQPERLRPSTIQEQKVAAGLLGKKTGRGYYEYRDH